MSGKRKSCVRMFKNLHKLAIDESSTYYMFNDGEILHLKQAHTLLAYSNPNRYVIVSRDRKTGKMVLNPVYFSKSYGLRPSPRRLAREFDGEL